MIRTRGVLIPVRPVTRGIVKQDLALRPGLHALAENVAMKGDPDGDRFLDARGVSPLSASRVIATVSATFTRDFMDVPVIAIQAP